MKNIEKRGYHILLEDIRSILKKGMAKAYKAVDNLKVQAYWQIGERIAREEFKLKRADYGQELIKKLASDLKAHERTLYRILKFYKAYPILTTVLSELSWSHYLVLIDIKDAGRRRFYETYSVKECWSVRDLKKMISSKEYEKVGKERVSASLLHLPSSPENVFKESYNWDFISLEDKHTEKQLETALLDNI